MNRENEIIIRTNDSTTTLLADLLNAFSVVSHLEADEAAEMERTLMTLYELYDNYNKDNLSLDKYSITVYNEETDHRIRINKDDAEAVNLIVNVVVPRLQRIMTVAESE